MKQIWSVKKEAALDSLISEAASLVSEGGVVVYPTETFYALGGLPMRGSVIRRIFAIKGRAADKPLPLIAGGMPAVRKAVAAWPPDAELLAESFWPGPLTLILPASTDLPAELHVLTGKIAVRVSPHPVALALAQAAGGLLISTSANVSGRPPVDHPDLLDPVLVSQVDGLIRSGKSLGQSPSTIVDVSTGPPRLVRSGCVPWGTIEETLQRRNVASI